MTLVTQLSLTAMGLLQNGLHSHSQVTPLWLMRLCHKGHCSVDDTLRLTLDVNETEVCFREDLIEFFLA